VLRLGSGRVDVPFLATNWGYNSVIISSPVQNQTRYLHEVKTIDDIIYTPNNAIYERYCRSYMVPMGLEKSIEGVGFKN
jgi:hypothetical protein